MEHNSTENLSLNRRQRFTECLCRFKKKKNLCQKLADNEAVNKEKQWEVRETTKHR